MKSFYVLIILSLHIITVYPQVSDCACSSAEDYGIALRTGLIGFEYHNPVDGYTGEQYFNNWTRGEFTLYNGDIVKDLLLRYDKYLDKLLWLKKNGIKTGVLNKDDIAAFRLYDERDVMIAEFIKTRIVITQGDSVNAFLQKMLSGELTLLVYRNVNVATNDYHLSDNTRYFIRAGGRDYMIALKRKSLLELPVIQKTEMKEILRSGISINNNEKGLIVALDLYNKKKVATSH